MPKKNLLIALIAVLVGANSMSAGRIRQNFDFGWKFRLGEQGEYKTVQLPHDWSISLDFNKEAGPESGYLPGGIGYYEKKFFVPKNYNGKRVSIVFDGIYHKATISLNGKEIAYHRYGYTSFETDLTPYLKFGESNTLSVQVDHSEKSRWYTGSGIYRHVWLQVTDPIHVKMWGTYVTTPQVTASSAAVSCVTTVANTLTSAGEIEIEQRLVDAHGNPLKISGKRYAVRTDVMVPGNGTKDIEQSFTLPDPQLWNLENPYLYRLETILKQKGKVIDRYMTRFGVRTIRFDKDKGFFLNEKNVKMKGMCLHQDAGCLGVAIPDRSYERRLNILKEFGVNAIRCSHNPPSPEFLDYCDSIGFLVIDEAFDKWKSGYYEQFFDECWRQDISDMMVRDRNHPSIILWSIGNELAEATHKDNVGVERATMLRDFVRKLEPTRPTMLALAPAYEDKFAAVTDVVGYNYSELSYIEDKKKHPERIGLISESYPYYSGLRPYEARDYSEKNPWNYVMEHDYICGSFMWAGIDYIGESMGWPSKGWAASPFDMCMDEKPRAAYFRAAWTDKPVLKMAVVDYSIDEDPGKDHWQTPPMVHDWTFPYTDSRVLPIHTPSNCDEVLLIDSRGKKYGPRKPKDYLNNTIIWNQPYRPGKVVAIGYKDGKEVCRDSIQTSGPVAARYTLRTDRSTLKADGLDLSFISLQLLDENGVPVRVNDRMVTARVEGGGRLMGIDSGEMRREQRFNSHSLPTYFGKCQIVVQAGRKKGMLKVTVQVEGLPEQELNITCS